MRKYFPALIFFLAASGYLGRLPLAQAETLSVSSSTAGVVLVSSIDHGIGVFVPSDADSAIWVSRRSAACSGLTTTEGVRIAAGNGYEFIPPQDGWAGQLCVILETAGNPVDVVYNRW